MSPHYCLCRFWVWTLIQAFGIPQDVVRWQEEVVGPNEVAKPRGKRSLTAFWTVESTDEQTSVEERFSFKT